ncbi:MAG: hypothetical protein M1828_005963 [Chrysothrix sp. TS-e1954]|nr:MAG: hypothetical protein M1828_005963 [Chrysothrix sp. TS-e1954]
MADCYAKRGNFQVFLPDFMNGVIVPEDVQTSFKAMNETRFWTQPLTKLGHLFYVLRCMLPFVYHCRPAVAGPRISGFLRGLKMNEARRLPIGAAGFAWGGYFVIRACWDQATNRTGDGQRILESGFVAHPSNSKYPKDIDKIVLPISWAAAETCRHMAPEQAKMTEQILTAKTAKGKDQGTEHEFVLYGGVNYGFAQSSDKKKSAEAEAGEKAEKQAVNWFSKRFASNALETHE